jgi:hypothetical protein
VHHGGIYTIKYHGQRFRKQPLSGLVNWNSLVITSQEFKKWRGFLNALVEKIADSSLKALTEFVMSEGIQLNRVNKKALWYLKWEDDD